MKKIDRIIFEGILPESFFTILPGIYANLPFDSNDNEIATRKLFLEQHSGKEIIIYTDHHNIRLTVIFDNAEGEARFGFWETTDDTELNIAAFNLLFTDARKRDVTKVIGPINFNTFNAYRIRNGNFPSWNKFDKEPVNPKYYESILKKMGFDEMHIYESRMIKSGDIPKVYEEKQALLNEVRNLSFNIIPLNENTWLQYEEDIYTLVLDIFAQNPVFNAIDKSSFLKLYNTTYAKGLCPHSSVLFINRQNNKPVAMSFCHPNYSSLQLPYNVAPDFSRDYEKLKQKILLAKTIGVHPAYRQRGLMNYLGAYAMLSFKQYYNEVIFCLMRSGNYSLQFTKDLPYESAVYALYQKSF